MLAIAIKHTRATNKQRNLGLGTYQAFEGCGQIRWCQKVFTCLNTQILCDNRWVSHKSCYLF